MSESGERASFLEETIQSRLEVLGTLGVGEHDGAAVRARYLSGGKILLDRDVFLQERVVREVGDAEAANAEHGQKVVLQQHGVKRKRVCIRSLCHDR